MDWMLTNGKRVFRIVLGFICLIVGAVLSVPFVPGPGIVFIVVGLGLLAVDFVWARRLRDKLKTSAKNFWDKARGR